MRNMSDKEIREIIDSRCSKVWSKECKDEPAAEESLNSVEIYEAKKNLDTQVDDFVKFYQDIVDTATAENVDAELEKADQDGAVFHPNHYNTGKYECWDVMKEVFGEEAFKAFCAMNAFKYLWRASKKGGAEDIKKAANYLTQISE